jgi:hypothetical protein
MATTSLVMHHNAHKGLCYKNPKSEIDVAPSLPDVSVVMAAKPLQHLITGDAP